jgi:hypothetical protein
MAFYGDPPALGMITFLDRGKVTPTIVRGARTWGRTWLLSGFRHVGETKGGLMAWQLLPADMPEPQYAIHGQPTLWVPSKASAIGRYLIAATNMKE